MSKIIITGTGLIAGQLADLLEKQGYEIAFLSTSRSSFKGFHCFHWDIDRRIIDDHALSNVDHIIHLAGSGIADKRWTRRRKKNIIDSRVVSANLLLDKIKEKKIPLKSFVSASGVGYYGAQTADKLFKETDPPYNDYVSNVCVRWENAALQFEDIDARIVIIRTGIVLSKSGGALQKLIKPIRIGFGAALGSGNQWMPWIHIDDICKTYLFALTSNISGTYNAVASEHVTNSELTSLVAKQVGRKIWLPNVPGILLRLFFGEMANIVLTGSKIDNSKLKESGFHFKFDSIEQALNNIYEKGI